MVYRWSNFYPSILNLLNLTFIFSLCTDKISNGQSSESINSFTEGQSASKPSTVAAARKVRFYFYRITRALYFKIDFPTFQSFNDSITGSTTFGKYGESLDSSCSTLDNSNRSFLSEERSPGSSPGVTIQPINYVSWQNDDLFPHYTNSSTIFAFSGWTATMSCTLRLQRGQWRWAWL